MTVNGISYDDAAGAADPAGVDSTAVDPAADGSALRDTGVFDPAVLVADLSPTQLLAVQAAAEERLTATAATWCHSPGTGLTSVIVHKSTTALLDPATLYRILALRVDVFVVEQQCPYPELDGRDLEPGTVHFWISDDDGAVLATLRLLRDDLPDGEWEYRIGRVCTAEAARGRGLTARLMRAALDEIGTQTSVLDAQSHLVEMYRRFGYRVSGPEFLEDGIPHSPMRR